MQLIPINKNKVPIPSEWQKTRKEYDFSNAYGRGLVCGALSGGVECIDIDLKYDLTGDLFDRLKRCIKDASPIVLEKMVVQKTPTGGYHMIYKCEKIDGNRKLAQRYTTDEEKAETYRKVIDRSLKAGKTETEARSLANHSAIHDKVRVLIETRGEGGYVAIYPTPDYKVVYGDLEKINTITPSERDLIISCCLEFNEILEEYKPDFTPKKKGTGLTPFEDYDERGDVLELLQECGWTVVSKKGSKVLVKRPGTSDNLSSGNYDYDKNWFSVFSTSTEFQPQKAYRPYAVYAVLKCDGDFARASRELRQQGYGDDTSKKEMPSTTPSRIDLHDDNLDFLATEKDYADYLESVKNGTFQMGLHTGFSTLDPFWLFKRSTFLVVNGHDNVGKSAAMWYMCLLSAMLHGWKWTLFSSENTEGFLMRKLHEFYWCKDYRDLTTKEIKTAREFLIEHFDIIKSSDKLYNYADVLRMHEKVIGKKHKDGLLIDPYNSLKIELTSASKLSTHEYHYEAISEMKLFGKQNSQCVYLNCHAVTNALRERDSDGYAKAPQKADTEGGGKFSNKADDFITLHRKTQSPDSWKTTEIHVRKVKEMETGGGVTPKDSPVKITSVGKMYGFEETRGTQTFNPVLNFHNRVETDSSFLEEPPF